MRDALEIHITPCPGMEDLRVYEIEIATCWWEMNQRVHHDHLVAAVHDAVAAYARADAPPLPRHDT